MGGEINRKVVRDAYVKLDAKRRNVDWFAAIEVLEKEKAIWSLLSCLAHPSDDVQIYALRSLEKIKDRKSAPFILIYAEYMAEDEGGSENATIHGVIHSTIAKTLSAITQIRIEINGQDPEGLKRAIRRWRKWTLENEK